MITYTATNTKTGRFYIGSAKNYCHFMNRKGNHHIGDPYNDFRKDLQSDPLSFIWDYYEDDLSERDFELSLLSLFVGSKRCYNLTTTNGFDTQTARLANSQIRDRTRSPETRQKMSESASRPEANPPHKKEAQREAMRKTANSKSPCPHCGRLMNPGNLALHIRRGRCTNVG